MQSFTGSAIRGDAPTPRPRGLSPFAAGATDIGQREHNEDHVLLRPELGLFLLADGAGGHNAGNIASALATTTVANVFETTAASLVDRPEVDAFGLPTVARRLSSAIHRANAEIIDIAKQLGKVPRHGHDARGARPLASRRRRRRGVVSFRCTWRTWATAGATACAPGSSRR